MPDGYAHKYNAQQALKVANYKPRNYKAFILGSNGPDPFFFYQLYNFKRNSAVNEIGHRLHNEKTGLFLQNLFRFAQTNAQKDYCLGFLCHYSMDSTVHPYINYITAAYNHPFSIENGHGWFESSLDSHISYHECGDPAAHPNAYIPEIKKMYLDQIVTLVKQAVEATYTDIELDRSEYTKVFNDFRKIKKLMYSPSKVKFLFSRIVEIFLNHPKGYVCSRMQPCTMPLTEIAMWRNNEMGFFCDATLEDLLNKATQLSADYINVGLQYFHGIYNVGDLLEDIGNKSYVTGVTIDN